MDNKDLVRIGLIVLAGIVLLYLVNSYSQKQAPAPEMEGFYAPEAESESEEQFVNAEAESEGAEGFVGGEPIVQPGESMGQNEIFSSVANTNGGEFGLNGNQYPKDCFPKDQLTPAELLPGDANSKWAQVNPAGQGELGDQNFLQAGYHVGVNTVGQTLRNANMQIRSEPPNPQVKVSPWLQSTIEPDTNRKPMEIGGCE